MSHEEFWTVITGVFVLVVLVGAIILQEWSDKNGEGQ